MSANKWVGGTLIVLGALTDAGALSGNTSRHGGPTESASLVVGTASLAGGLWLWNEGSKRGGQHRTRTARRSGPRYTGRAR